MADDMERTGLTSLVRSSGCNAKLPPGDLHRVLSELPPFHSEALIAGYESADDAFVYDLGDGRVLIETVDFFPPMVDDPFLFGEIAAANALSDIYAMGAEPSVALSIACFPSCLDLDVLKSIMLGARSKTDEAGCAIAGGHTISDREPKFGLAVTAVYDKDKVWTNGGAISGDSIILTKRLGVGVLMTASKGGECPEDAYDDAVSSMRTLNRHARNTAMRYSVHAATDVTGFSLLGHSAEMAEASGCTIEIDSSSLPVHQSAYDLAAFGFLPEGRYTNEDYIGSKVSFPEGFDQTLKDLMFSPETSGGLLLSMPKDDAENYVRSMEGNAWIIGRVIDRASLPVAVIM